MAIGTPVDERRWQLGALAGCMFLLAGLVELIPALLLLRRHGAVHGFTWQAGTFGAGVAFLSVGLLWLAIAFRLKKSVQNGPRAAA